MSGTNGRVLMDYGSIAKVKEFDGDGNVVFNAQFGDDNAVASYRDYRCQWHAAPFWKPSLVVRRTDTGANVSMSWNGATDYDNWAVYSVISEKSVEGQWIRTVPRTGFETTVTLTDVSSHYIQVVARQGETVLSKPEVVPF